MGVWVQLPPPVQQAAPYAGAALASGVVVFAVQQYRLKNQVRRARGVRDHGALRGAGVLLAGAGSEGGTVRRRCSHLLLGAGGAEP